MRLLPIDVKIFDNQPRYFVKNSKGLLAGYAIDSGFLAAKFFGAISANIIMNKVSSNVPIQTYSSPNCLIIK